MLRTKPLQRKTPLKPGKGLKPSSKRMKQRKRACGNATAEQQDHQDAQRAAGCAVCVYRIEAGLQDASHGQCGDTDVHHRNLGDKHGAPQLGQDATVALGKWHHDGVIREGWNGVRMYAVFGPSFAAQPREFRIWTADVLPQYPGIGTERWQRWQDERIARQDKQLGALA